jgi:ketosteroid isomerase-like protein
MTDEVLIRHLLDDRQTAMRERDAETLISRYTDDAVTFDLAPPLLTSGPRDLAARQAWLAGFDGPIDFEITEIAVTVDGDIAFCHSLNRLGAVPRGTGYRFQLWFRATLGLRKIDDEWRITHEHNSTPFYMDGSFRAAVDLTP